MSEFFYLKIFSFLEVKFSIYLNRRVFVMEVFRAPHKIDKTIEIHNGGSKCSRER